MAQSPRRPWPQRLTAFFLAALFLLAGAREGIAGYVCAKHSDHGEHAVAVVDGHQAHGSHEAAAGHEGHGSHGQTAASTSAGADPHGDGEPCSCVGDCQPGQTSVAHVDGYITTADVLAPPAVRLPSSAEASLPGAPKFLLPYSNGPPLLG